jgi:hypothetical protein
MAKPARQPTPLDKVTTDRRRNLRTGQLQIWGAVSADNRWVYSREEMPTTPWIVTKRGEWGEQWFGTLMAARRWTSEFDAKANAAAPPANLTNASVYAERYNTTTERWYIIPGQRPADHVWHSRRPGHLELSVHTAHYVTLSGLLTELPMADLRKAG